jgi:hypothetical protein
MEQNENQADEGRFEVVFKSLNELQAEEADSGVGQDTIRENEAIDELRRLSVEFAESPRLSYTTTSAPTPPAVQSNFVVLGVEQRPSS